jgi:hypothetical protein
MEATIIESQGVTMSTLTAPSREIGEEPRDEVARLVLEWKRLADSGPALTAGGAAAAKLDEHRRAVDRVQERLGTEVKRRLAADPQLTRRLMLRAFELG